MAFLRRSIWSTCSPEVRKNMLQAGWNRGLDGESASFFFLEQSQKDNKKTGSEALKNSENHIDKWKKMMYNRSPYCGSLPI